MSLIPYVEAEQASEEVKQLWEEVTGRFVSYLGPMAEGLVPSAVKTLAHCPSILKAFWALDDATFSEDGVLDVRLKCLACMRTSLTNCSNYCTTHIYHLGRAVGLTDDALLSVADFERSPLFSAKEKLVMRFARELTAKPGALDKQVLEELRATFNPPEIVELMMVIFLMNMLNRLHLAMGDEIDLDLAPLALYPQPLKAKSAS